MPRFNFEASYGAGYYPEVKRLTLPEMQLVGFTRRLDFASEQELEYSSCMAMKDEIFNDFFKGLHRRLSADLQHLLSPCRGRRRAVIHAGDGGRF